MSLELCAKVANSNSKASTDYQVIKLKGNVAMATNLRNTIRYQGTPFPSDIDCVVDSETFMKTYKVFKAPIVKREEQSLKLTEGKTKAEISLRESFFPFEVDKEIREGTTSVEPKNFIAAVDAISSFLALSTPKTTPEAYIIGKFIYVTDGKFLVRTPIETEFPEQTERPLTLSKEFVDILLAVKKPAVEILVSQDSFVVIFEDLWIETSRYAGDMPADFESYFAYNTDKILEALPEDVLGTLKSICDLGDKDDTISFSKMGISLMKQGKVSFNIAYEMPSLFMMNCDALKTILNVGAEFNFEDIKRVLFKGKNVEGSWAKYSAFVAAPQEPAKASA